MYCKQCGNEIEDTALFCGFCGCKMVKSKKSCPKCHNQYQSEIVFCGNCGTLLCTSSAAGNRTQQISTMPQMACYFASEPGFLAAESGTLAFYNTKMEMITQGDVGKLRTKYKIIEPGKINNCLRIPYSNIKSVSRGMKKNIPYFTLGMENGEVITFQAQTGTTFNPEMQMKLVLSILENHIEE